MNILPHFHYDCILVSLVISYQVFSDRVNGKSASTSGSTVFTSYFAIFCDQAHNKYGAYLFHAFLAVKTVLQEGCADLLFKIKPNTWNYNK